MLGGARRSKRNATKERQKEEVENERTRNEITVPPPSTCDCVGVRDLTSPIPQRTYTYSLLFWVLRRWSRITQEIAGCRWVGAGVEGGLPRSAIAPLRIPSNWTNWTKLKTKSSWSTDRRTTKPSSLPTHLLPSALPLRWSLRSRTVEQIGTGWEKTKLLGPARKSGFIFFNFICFSLRFVRFVKISTN